MKYHFRTSKENKIHYRLLFYALLIGILVGLVSSIFRIVLSLVEELRKDIFSNVTNETLISYVWPFLFVLITVSISVFLVRKYAPETAGSGIQEIEGALDGVRPMRWQKVIPIKFIASIFSLGSGMLLGREGPTIQLGASIGKMIKDTLAPESIKDNPLISSGAAAGLASAFNAPFAGIIFVIEEMHEHFKWNFFSVAAIMIGAGSSDMVVRTLIETKPSIEMSIFSSPEPGSLWLYILLGVLLSILGYTFNLLLLKSLDNFQFLNKKPIILTGFIVAITITSIGIYYPEMIGGGYHTVTKVLDHSFSLSFLLILLVARMLLTLFSYGTGVAGGIFVPLLTLGVIVGMFYGSVMQDLFPEHISHSGVFAVAGMAGIFAATVRAPLTGLVLAVEMTSNYELILPLILTTVSASVITTLMGNKPIYATLLTRTLNASKS